VRATWTRNAADGREAALRSLTEEGCAAPRFWGNRPGDTYGRHSHDRHKVLFCLAGSITFHLREGDVTAQTGDRLDIPAGTDHAATVGPDGCSCVEAWR
jgi:mannose-6-phosphate isomerase-like protein (cupin superfamily)